MSRTILHLYLCFCSLYLLIVIMVVYYMRNSQRNIGDNALLAKRVSKWPYGTLFFQSGEYFDCALCLKGIWAEDKIVKLACNNGHVFHKLCLESCVKSGMRCCALCNQPIVAVPPTP